jgi:hypothetical protein
LILAAGEHALPVPREKYNKSKLINTGGYYGKR